MLFVFMRAVVRFVGFQLQTVVGGEIDHLDASVEQMFRKPHRRFVRQGKKCKIRRFGDLGGIGFGYRSVKDICQGGMQGGQRRLPLTRGDVADLELRMVDQYFDKLQTGKAAGSDHRDTGHISISS